MPKKAIISPQLAPPNGHFAQATVIETNGRLVFISGMTARTQDGSIAGVGDITAQTHQVCQNLKAAVEAAEGTLDDIARVDVYVRNMEDFDAIHAVRRQYFTGVAPASTMVEVSKFVNKDYLIEINAIAAIRD
ncbi:RidA family protein [Streptomyces sp. NPDC091377]|uniref:RidA family protein n=1 Tax=Streptomyces sp. NPDC091377 TaxID=3365995 RepID=UPI0038103E09